MKLATLSNDIRKLVTQKSNRVLLRCLYGAFCPLSLPLYGKEQTGDSWS